MFRRWGAPFSIAAATIVCATVAALSAAQHPEPWPGMLDEHPSIQYAKRPTTDRAATLSQALARGERTIERDLRTGYLKPLLDAFGLSVESQLLIFSKTGVQGGFTSARTPRAVYFDESVAIGYIPGAPVLEIAAHDPQQGVVFYTVDQSAPKPSLSRRTGCVSCHISASTLGVPGMIARSSVVGDDGRLLAGFSPTTVDHQTGHPDRWGGWFVTAGDGVPPYSQRAHMGNITFMPNGNTSNEVFVSWLNSAPESRGYLSSSSDIAALLVFDHQMHAINLLTRLNWEARIESKDVGPLATQLADYFLFEGEAPPAARLFAPRAFADRLEAKTPKDRRGRSFGQLDLANRLLRYPCSYMIYSEAFNGLPSAVRQRVYARMLEKLSASTPDRRAVLEILRETKPDFSK